MKAAQFSQFGGPEILEIVDLPEPHSGLGQIRSVVHAAGINATEWKLRKGLLNFRAGLPQTTGRDVAGVVDEVGEGLQMSLSATGYSVPPTMAPERSSWRC